MEANAQMKTLDEFNDEKNEERRKFEARQHLAKVLCPKCKENGKDVEMHYKNPMWINASFPPSKTVLCPECDYHGNKVVW